MARTNPASIETLERFSAAELERMPTLTVGHAEDLKYDDGHHRWWLDRVGPESGASFKVSVEELLPIGKWRTVHEYEPYTRTNMARQSNKRGRGGCPPGQIRRKGYTTKRGVKVASTCIIDRGAPGKGPQVIRITHEGKLGGPGYLDKSATTRHRLLSKAVKKDDYRSTLGSINALAVLGKREFSKSDQKKLKADRNWLVKKYGGPGSFGGRSSNPEVRRLKNNLLR